MPQTCNQGSFYFFCQMLKVSALCAQIGQKELERAFLKKSLDFTCCLTIQGHRDAGARKESCLCVAGRSQAASGPNDLILLPHSLEPVQMKKRHLCQSRSF